MAGTASPDSESGGSHVSTFGNQERELPPTRKETAIEMRWRRVGAVCLAGVACVVVIALGASEGGQRREGWGTGSEAVLQRLLQSSASAVGGMGNGSGQERSRITVQSLLAYVEKGLWKGKDRAGLDGGELPGPVELLQAKTPCTGECLVRKQAIAAKMKALRDQINDDFSQMIDFGHKAGYLAPPQSIREQVMSGTLLKGDGKTGADAKAPPPFDPTKVLKGVPTKLEIDDSKVKTEIEKSSKSPEQSSETKPDDSKNADSGVDSSASVSKTALTKSQSAPAASSSSSADSGEAKGSAEASTSAAASNDDSSSDKSIALSTSSESTTSDKGSDSSSGSSQGGSSAWEKAFSFIKDTGNPVAGGGSTTKDTDIYSKTVKLVAFKTVAKEDKFLQGFDNPTGEKSGSSSDAVSSTSDLNQGDTFGASSTKKGSNPLKDAESDKFLAGFLGE